MDWNPASSGPSQDRSIVDDRLATVLRAAVTGEASARTQLRQLIDLLGSLASTGQDAPDIAFDRLELLLDRLPATQVAAILAEPGLRLRNVQLVARLAEAGPPVSISAMAHARLDDGEWGWLIPRLPIVARGLLRHRRDLPPGATATLARLGISDLVLTAPADLPDDTESSSREEGVGAILRRIDAFRHARQQGDSQAQNPPADDEPESGSPVESFDFSTDGDGVIDWAEEAIAPAAIGMHLGSDHAGALAVMDRVRAAAMRHCQPLRQAMVDIDAAPALTGKWSVDAMPRFDRRGNFIGYAGRMRRARVAPPAADANAAEADRIRQLLHELRTPVNAIQGFAEVIQQQVFGPAPNEYRALAAAVAVDAARLMAGFDELERLTRLELRALTLSSGSADLRACVADTLRRLEGAMRPRHAHMDFEVAGTDFLVPLEGTEILQLAWRFLATLAGALEPGEAIGLSLTSDAAQIALRAELPRTLKEQSDLFSATAPARAQAVSAGAFGSGFALRLARAEAASVGGSLHRTDDFVELILPAIADSAAGTAGAERENFTSA